MILGLVFCICTAIYAKNKGYSFLAWFFAGGLIGLIILAFLPDTVDVKTLMGPEKVNRLRKKGNYIGIVSSVLSIVVGVLIAFSRVHSR